MDLVPSLGFIAACLVAQLHKLVAFMAIDVTAAVVAVVRLATIAALVSTLAGRFAD